MKQFYADPLGFVLFAYPWGEPGTELEHEAGPDEYQKQFLEDLGREVTERGFNGSDPVMPILFTATSGHGTGKSVMGAWIANWILSTRPDSIGTVTAGTFAQLESRYLVRDPALDHALHHWPLVHDPGARRIPQASPQNLEDRCADLQGTKRAGLRRPARADLHLLVHVR